MVVEEELKNPERSLSQLKFNWCSVVTKTCKILPYTNIANIYL
jgi:hypothetical protein